jgi:hypothetical protein
VIDEVAGLVVLDTTALASLMTLAALGANQLVSIVGVVVVASVGSICLAVMVSHRGDNRGCRPVRMDEPQSNSTATAVAMQPSSTTSWPTKCRTYSQLELDQVDAIHRRSSGLSAMGFDTMSKPDVFVGAGWTEPVDHGMKLRLASPRAP